LEAGAGCPPQFAPAKERTMNKYCVAYKNEYTTQAAKEQQDAKNGWQRISGFVSWDEAKRIYEIRKTEFKKSAIAIFMSRDNSTTPWFCRRPRRIFNQHILTENQSIHPALSNLINSLDSSWF